MPYKDPEKAQQYQREYKRKHKARIDALSKKWRENNPERWREIRNKAALGYYYRHHEECVALASERNQSDEWKAYSHEWYEAHKKEIAEQQKRRWEEDAQFREKKLAKMAERRFATMEWVNEHKAKSGCVFCGEKNAECLDFHHRDKNEKENGISALVQSNYSRKRIVEEIAKCEVVCANCHRKLHANKL